MRTRGAEAAMLVTTREDALWEITAPFAAEVQDHRAHHRRRFHRRAAGAHRHGGDLAGDDGAPAAAGRGRGPVDAAPRGAALARLVPGALPPHRRGLAGVLPHAH